MSSESARDTNWFGYIIFSLALIIGTALVADEAGLEDAAFGWAMIGAWAVVLGGFVFRRVRHRLAQSGVWILTVVWLGGQVVLVGWLTWQLLDGVLNDGMRIGWLWVVLLGGWYVFLWWQFSFVLDDFRYRARSRAE